MITTERQYKVTQTEACRLREALSRFDAVQLAAQGIDPIIVEAQRSSLFEQLNDLERDLARYEQLKSGETLRLSADTLIQLGELLIEARIANGLSQRELAERLGMKEQQVQRYEQERYRTANLTRLEAVAAALSIRLDTQIELRGRRALDDMGFDPKRLPIRYMKKRGWLNGLMAIDSVPEADAAAEYVRRSGAGTRFRSLHRQNVRAGSTSDEYALLAWKARVLHKAREVSASDASDDLSIDFVRSIVQCSVQPNGPALAVSMLRERGVAVVFEDHLPRTHLDGAALLLENNVPVIGITLRYNRLDNFWFVLLHEIAHIIRHRKKLEEGFFDDMDAKDDGGDIVEEREADEYALEWLIPGEVWRASLVRFTTSRDAIIQFASRQGVSPAIVAGRIRKERAKQGGYRLFSDLVGEGAVRPLLQQAGYVEG